MARHTTAVTALAVALLLAGCDDGAEDGADAVATGAAVAEAPATGAPDIAPAARPDAAADAAAGTTTGGMAEAAPAREATTMTTSASPPAEGVTVAGTGTASGRPDLLRATIGVSVRRADVQGALDAANAAATDVLAALRAAGLGDADLQTTQLSVQPEYAQPPERGGSPAVTGYVVTNLVEARIRDLDRAGTVLADGVAAGGDAARLHGVQLEITDDTALLARAREAAFAAARDTAEQYAELAGRNLGELVSVAEDTGAAPPQPFAVEAMTADAAVPVEAGRHDVSVTVTTVWSFG